MPNRPAIPPPFSVRLTQDERARLERDACGMALGVYVRWRLFDPSNPPRHTRGKAPVKDHWALAELTGKLGSSRIASNLNQLAKAANSGSLALDPELEAELRQALADVAAMRRMLIEALGLNGGAS